MSSNSEEIMKIKTSLILEKLEEGLTIKEILKILNVSWPTITNILIND